MPLFEIILKIMHDCPIANITRDLPNVKMIEWCNRQFDVMEIIAEDSEDYSTIINKLSKTSEIIEEMHDGKKMHLVTKTCDVDSYNSTSSHYEEFNMLQLPPVVYERGWEYHHLIAFKHDSIKKTVSALKNDDFEVEILRKVPFRGSIAGSLTLTLDALFSDLTGKQIDALLSAYSQGYFTFPRKANVKSIAAKKKVPRTTFTEHLNKAEGKLVKALVPHIQLFRKSIRMES